MTRNILNSSYGCLFICCVAAELVMIAVALDFWGATGIRGDAGEVLFLTSLGAVWLVICINLFNWMGLGFRDDVVERRNPGTLAALCGATIATTLIYAGGSVGEGPSYMNNVFSVGLAMTGFFFLWVLFEASGRISMSIAEERDLASGIRFGGFLAALGLVLGRAVAGNWHSEAGTVHDFFHDGWPGAVLWAIALITERFARPNRRRPFPSWAIFGLIPAILYVTLAGAWLWHLGAWEGMPK